MKTRTSAGYLAFVLVFSGCSFGTIVGRGQPSPPSVAEAAQQEIEALATVDAAREAFANGDFPNARRLVERTLEDAPDSEGAGQAAVILIRTVRELTPDEAAAVERSIRASFHENHPAWTDLAVLRAEDLLGAGDAATAVETLIRLRLDRDPAATEGRRVFSEALPRIPTEVLATVTESVPVGHPFAGVLFLESAERAVSLGDSEEGARRATRALQFPLAVDERNRARAIAEAGNRFPEDGAQPSAFDAGRQEALQSWRYDPYIVAARAALRDRMVDGAIVLRQPSTIGVVLPQSGSPTLQAFATEVEEGIRTALSEAGEPEGLSLSVVDDGGTVPGAASAIRNLESDPLLAVIGPLTDEGLLSAADARARAIPMISPIALETGSRDGVLSLNAFDPGGATALAEYAAAGDIQQVVVLHPQDLDHTAEAQAFRERFVELGGSVLRTLTYAPGTTYFEEALETVRLLQPEALVLPIPREDVPAIAPQVSFFGLDSLGIRLMGTADWTAEEVLANVPTRNINGTVVAAPRPPEGELEGLERFVASYESTYRRSLVDPTVPALGYDAASLLLQALRLGARTPAEVRATLERVRDFPGASGVLSVRDGQIVRERYLACVQDGRLLPIEPGERPVAFRPERPGDPELGEPETVPLGAYQVYCPGVPIPGVGETEQTP